MIDTVPKDASERFFDAEFLRKLERVELLSRKLFKGMLRGERTTRRRGRGLEFTDFRPYRPGDDVRHIDWNILSRLDRLFLKLYASEEDISLHLLIDASRSMSFGNPSKFDHARRIAAALAYVGLASMDRVSLVTFSNTLDLHLPARKSRSHLPAVLDFLSHLECGGATGLSISFEAFIARYRHPGIVVLISDLLSDDSVRRALQLLRHGGHDVVVIQLLAEEEIDPVIGGALRLIDAESNERLDVTVDAALAESYQHMLSERLRVLEEDCRSNGIEYLRASTAIAFEDVVLKYLRQGALLA